MIYSIRHIQKLQHSNEIMFILFICLRKLERLVRLQYEEPEDIESFWATKKELAKVVKEILKQVEIFKACNLVLEPILKVNILLTCGDLKVDGIYEDLKVDVEKIEAILEEILNGK